MTAPHAARIGSVGCGCFSSVGTGRDPSNLDRPSTALPRRSTDRETSRGGRQHRRQRRGVAELLRSVSPMTDPRAVSFWLDSLPADHDLTPCQQLPGDVTADVAIVGAGNGIVDCLLPAPDRSHAAHRRGGGRVRRVRRQRSQWWMAVGAAADELREDGREPRSRPCRALCSGRCTAPSTRSHE